MALAAPLGPLVGLLVADRVERKWVIVTMAGVNVAAGLLFAQADGHSRDHPSWRDDHFGRKYHLLQLPCLPAGAISDRYSREGCRIRLSWSRFSAIFTAFIISWLLEHFGVPGVFVFIGGAYLVVMLDIGLLGPRTKDIALEKISH